MGIPISELQSRISSSEFSEYMISLLVDPDSATRLDALLSIIAQLLSRIEGTLGGRPPHLKTPLIEWGTTPQESDEIGIFETLESVNRSFKK